MSIKEAAEKYHASIRKICNYQQLFDSLSKEDKVSLTELLDKKTPLSIVSKILKSEGYKISDHTIDNHLKGVCRCPKE